MKNRTSADTVDCNAVNQVGVSPTLSRTYRPREEAQRGGLDSRVSEPTDINSNPAGLLLWKESYGGLWKLKMALEKQNNR